MIIHFFSLVYPICSYQNFSSRLKYGVEGLQYPISSGYIGSLYRISYDDWRGGWCVDIDIGKFVDTLGYVLCGEGTCWNDGLNGLYNARDNLTIIINVIIYPIFVASIVAVHANWALIRRDLPSELVQLFTFSKFRSHTVAR